MRHSFAAGPAHGPLKLSLQSKLMIPDTFMKHLHKSVRDHEKGGRRMTRHDRTRAGTASKRSAQPGADPGFLPRQRMRRPGNSPDARSAHPRPRTAQPFGIMPFVTRRRARVSVALATPA
jgi:hypothetical protein